MLGRQNADLKLQWINRANDQLDKLYSAKEAVSKYLEIINQKQPGSGYRQEKLLSFIEWSNFDMTRLVKLATLEKLICDPVMVQLNSKTSIYQELLLIYEDASSIQRKLKELNLRNQETTDDFRRLYAKIIKSGIYPPEIDKIKSVMDRELHKRKLENSTIRPNAMLAAVRDITEDATTMDSDHKDVDYLQGAPKVEQLERLIDEMLGRGQVKGKEVDALVMLKEQAQSYQLSLSRYEQLCSLCNSIMWVNDFAERLGIEEKSLNVKCARLKTAILNISSEGNLEEYKNWLHSCKQFTFTLPPVSDVVNTTKAIYWNQDVENKLNCKDLTVEKVSNVLKKMPKFDNIGPTHYQLANRLLNMAESWKKRASNVLGHLEKVASEHDNINLSQLSNIDGQLIELLEQIEDEQGLGRFVDLKEQAKLLSSQEIILKVARLLKKVESISTSKGQKLDFNAFFELRQTLKMPAFETLREYSLVNKFQKFVQETKESEDALKDVIMNLDKKKPLKVVIFYDPEIMTLMKQLISIESIKERLSNLEQYFFLGNFGSEVKDYLKKYQKTELSLLEMTRTHNLSDLEACSIDKINEIIKDFDRLKQEMELKIQSSNLEDLAAYEWSLHAAKLSKSPKVRLEDIDKHIVRVSHLKQTGIAFIDQLRDKKNQAIELRRPIEEALRTKDLNVEDLFLYKQSLMKSNVDFPGLLRKLDVRINDHEFINQYMKEIDIKLQAKQKNKRPSLAELEHLLAYIRGYHLSIPIVEVKISLLIDQCNQFCANFRDFIVHTSLRVNRDIDPLIQQYTSLGIIIREIELTIIRREDALNKLKDVSSYDIHGKNLKQLIELETWLRDSLDEEKNSEMFDTVMTCKAKQVAILTSQIERSKFPTCMMKQEDFFLMLAKLPLAIEHNPLAFQNDVNKLLIAKEKIQKQMKDSLSNPQKYLTTMMFDFLDIRVDPKKPIEEQGESKVTQVINKPDPKQPGVQDVTLEGGYNSKEQFSTLRKDTRRKLKNILSSEMNLERKSETNYYAAQIDDVAASRTSKSMMAYSELVDAYIKFVRVFKNNIYLCNIVIQKGFDKSLLSLIMEAYGRFSEEGFSEFEARSCIMEAQLSLEARKGKYSNPAVHLGEKLDIPPLEYIVKETKKRLIQERDCNESSPVPNHSQEIDAIAEKMNILREQKTPKKHLNLLSSSGKKSKHTQTSMEEQWADNSSTEKGQDARLRLLSKRTGRSIQTTAKKQTRKRLSRKGFTSDKKCMEGDSPRRYSEAGADSSTKVQSMKQEVPIEDKDAEKVFVQNGTDAPNDDFGESLSDRIIAEETDEDQLVQDGPDMNERPKKVDSQNIFQGKGNEYKEDRNFIAQNSDDIVPLPKLGESSSEQKYPEVKKESSGEHEILDSITDKPRKLRKMGKKALAKARKANKILKIPKSEDNEDIKETKVDLNDDLDINVAKKQQSNGHKKSDIQETDDKYLDGYQHLKIDSLKKDKLQDALALESTKTDINDKSQTATEDRTGIGMGKKPSNGQFNSTRLNFLNKTNTDTRPQDEKDVSRKSSDNKIIVPQVNRPLLSGFNKCLPFTPVTKSDDHEKLMNQFKREVKGLENAADDRVESEDYQSAAMNIHHTRAAVNRKGKVGQKKKSLLVENIVKKGLNKNDQKETQEVEGDIRGKGKGQEREMEKTGRGRKKLVTSAIHQETDENNQNSPITRVPRSRAGQTNIKDELDQTTTPLSLKGSVRQYSLRGGPLANIPPPKPTTKRQKAATKTNSYLGKRKATASKTHSQDTSKQADIEAAMGDDTFEETEKLDNDQDETSSKPGLRDRVLIGKLRGRPTQRRMPAVLEAAARSKIDEYSIMIAEEKKLDKPAKSHLKKKLENKLDQPEVDEEYARGTKKLKTDKMTNTNPEESTKDQHANQLASHDSVQMHKLDNHGFDQNNDLDKADNTEKMEDRIEEEVINQPRNQRPTLVAPPRRKPIVRIQAKREQKQPLRVICSKNKHVYVPRNMIHGDSSRSSDTEDISDGEADVFKDITTFEDFKSMKLRIKRERSRKETKQHKSMLSLSKVISQKEDSKETEACTQKATPKEERIITVKELTPSPQKSEDVEQKIKVEQKPTSVGFWVIYQNKIDFAIDVARRGDFKLVSLTEVSKIQETCDFTDDQICINQVMTNTELEQIVNEQAPSVGKTKSQWIQGFLFTATDQEIVSDLLESETGQKNQVFWGRLTPRMRIFLFRPQDITPNMVQIMTRLKDAEPYSAGLSFLIIEEQMTAKNTRTLRPQVFEERMQEEQLQLGVRRFRRDSDPDRGPRSLQDPQLASRLAAQARADRRLNDDFLNFEQNTRKQSAYDAEMDLDNVLEKNHEKARYQNGGQPDKASKERSRSREKAGRDVGMDSISSIISR